MDQSNRHYCTREFKLKNYSINELPSAQEIKINYQYTSTTPLVTLVYTYKNCSIYFNNLFKWRHFIFTLYYMSHNNYKLGCIK